MREMRERGEREEREKRERGEREREKRREREREREMMMKDHLLLRTLKLFCFKHVIVIIIQRACMQ